MNRQYILSLFCLLVSLPMLAQKQKALKYKEVLEVVEQGPDIRAYQVLKDFQAQQPEANANVYYQLGILCHKWMREYDPLKQVEDVQYFALHTRVYLGICQSKLSKGEVSASGYYASIKPPEGQKKVKLEDVQLEIKNRLEDVKLFEENHAKMLMNFQKSLEQYDQCIDLFMSINEENSNLKNLFLTADIPFLNKLSKLYTTYENAVKSFKAYQAVVNDYPIGDYQPELIIKSIDTYRLNGLTSSNFLSNEVMMWDFGKWVADFRATLAEEIKELRAEVDQTGKALDDRIAFFAGQSGFDNDWEGYTIPNKVAFHIYKWDYQSELLTLFRYQEAKVKYLQQTKLKLNDPKYSTDFQEKAQYYQGLISEKTTIDKAYTATQSLFSPVGFARHKSYLSKKYGSTQGVKAYLQEENRQNERLLKQSIEQFQQFTQDKLKQELLTYKGFAWKKTSISTKNYEGFADSLIVRTQPDTLLDGRYFTYDAAIATDGSSWITGFYKPTTRFARAFVAKTVKTDSTEELMWVKLLKVKEGLPNIGMQIQPKGAGGIVLLTVVSDTILNFKITLDEKGKVVEEDTLHSIQYPRMMEYDEINDELLVMCKGMQLTEQINQREQVDIRLLDVSLQAKWKQTFGLKGAIVDILRSNNDFYVFGTYTELESEKSNWLTTSSSAIYSIKLPSNGEVRSTQSYTSSTPLSLMKVVKNSSDTFSLLGARKSITPVFTLLGESYPFYYGLVNVDGTVVFENE